MISVSTEQAKKLVEQMRRDYLAADAKARQYSEDARELEVEIHAIQDQINRAENPAVAAPPPAPPLRGMVAPPPSAPFPSKPLSVGELREYNKLEEQWVKEGEAGKGSMTPEQISRFSELRQRMEYANANGHK